MSHSINLMLDDLHYRRELSNSDTFSYDVVNDCKLTQEQMSTSERKQLLKLMGTKHLIQIIETSGDVFKINTSETYFPLVIPSVDDYEWPKQRLVGPIAMPTFSRLLRRMNISDERDREKKHHATIRYHEALLTIEVDNYEPKVAAKTSYESDVSRFLQSIFTQQPGKLLQNTELVEGWSVHENLDQFIKKRRLDCILPFLDINYLPRALKLKAYTIYLTDDELKRLLEQIRAKYRNNFQDISESI